jgi:hypothetical protein
VWGCTAPPLTIPHPFSLLPRKIQQRRLCIVLLVSSREQKNKPDKLLKSIRSDRISGKVFLIQRVLASIPGEEEGQPQEDAEDKDAHLEGKGEHPKNTITFSDKWTSECL